MTRRLRRLLVLVAWVAALGWLIRYEVFPEYFTHAMAGYRSLFSSDVLMQDTWTRLMVKGHPIGYSHTSIETRESNAQEYYAVEGRVRLRMNLMGEGQAVQVDMIVHLDVMQRLQNFSFVFEAPHYKARIRGQRVNREMFDVVMKLGAAESRTTAFIPDDVVLHSPLTELAIKKLRPGEELTFKLLDPTTMETARVRVKALRQETIQLAGTSHWATVIASDYHGAQIHTWLDASGQMLRQETPFGWSLERCTIDEAFEALRTASGAPDMLTAMAVPCSGALPNPRQTRQVRLRLQGVPFSAAELESNRQQVLHSAERDYELVSNAAAWPSAGAREPVIPREIQRHLAPTPALQADHPEIVERARAITQGKLDAAAKAEAIYEWVHAHVEKEMTVSLPSALDVLRTLKGDCNEHTYLFVALARAAGVPAVIKVGLAYHQGAFYYHAWPAAYVGDWVELDPTWGQPLVDATHLALVTGELTQQAELVKVLGQLKIAILESK